MRNQLKVKKQPDDGSWRTPSDMELIKRENVELRARLNEVVGVISKLPDFFKKMGLEGEEVEAITYSIDWLKSTTQDVLTVGTIVRLKRNLLGNDTGTLGVCYYDYQTGVQCIFENGNYDGFSVNDIAAFLEIVGVEPTLRSYEFKSTMKVSADFAGGVFNVVFDKNWMKKIKEKAVFKNKSRFLKLKYYNG